jgi:uncharacterized membrane protein (DUF4010 family)
MKFFEWLPQEGSQILFVLFLSFLIGLEREERKSNDDHFAFGGVRTFPLIGMIGYSLSVLSNDSFIPFLVGFFVIALFLLKAYQHKVEKSGYAGVTTEMSALTTYLIGGLVQKNLLWVATALVVSTILLLSLKNLLEDIAKRLGSKEILIFAQFLLLSAVILPLLPYETYTQFQLNPLKIWLVVVAVSGVSYVSYILHKLNNNTSSVLWAAVLGGVYSSTVTTLVLARKSKLEDRPRSFAGAILIASGVMYLRLIALLALFNIELMKRLGVVFICLSALAIIFGYIWAKSAKEEELTIASSPEVKNPLDFSAAIIFGAIFVAMSILSQYAVQDFGDKGLYTLATIMGLVDIDPFVMSLATSTLDGKAIEAISIAILIATSANNFIKGIYAYSLSSTQSRLQSGLFLLILAALGLAAIAFLF